MANAVKCGTPNAFCSGRNVTTTAALNKFTKVHSDSLEAFNCYARYLVKEAGYTKVGSREFQNPTTGTIEVLTKKCRYGAKMRGGKSGGETRGKRMNPKNNRFVIKGS